ncbi:MAG: hypothetical protein JJU36_14215 [Phycisphaeraceae bacterium]|nr:hypothetical protein [Phycisphaeraceae bacterium]
MTISALIAASPPPPADTEAAQPAQRRIEDPAWWIAEAVKAADAIDARIVRSGETDTNHSAQTLDWIFDSWSGLLAGQAVVLHHLELTPAALERIGRARGLVERIADVDIRAEAAGMPAWAALYVQPHGDAGPLLEMARPESRPVLRHGMESFKAALASDHAEMDRALTAFEEAVAKLQEGEDRDIEFDTLAFDMADAGLIEPARHLAGKITDLGWRLEAEAWIAIVEYLIKGDVLQARTVHDQLRELEKKALDKMAEDEDKFWFDREAADALLAGLEILMGLDNEARQRERRLDDRVLRAQVSAFRAMAASRAQRPADEVIRHATNAHHQVLRAAREELDDTVVTDREAMVVYRLLAAIDHEWTEEQLERIGILETTSRLHPMHKAGIYTAFAQGMINRKRWEQRRAATSNP